MNPVFPAVCAVALLFHGEWASGAIVYTLPPVPLNVTGSILSPIPFDIDADGGAEFGFYAGSALSMTPYDESRSGDVFGSARSFEKGELVGLVVSQG